RRLLLVGGGEAAGARDLVEPEPGPARRLCVLGDAVVVFTMLGDRERDPLAGSLRQGAAAQLGAPARAGAEAGGAAGDDADEPGDRAPGRLDRLDQRRPFIGRRQLVVDLKSAYCGFYRHVASRFWLC